MRNVLEFKTTHQHPTLGELIIKFSVASNGDLELDEVRYVHQEKPGILPSRIIYSLRFGWRDEQWCVDFFKWTNGNGIGGGFGAVTNQPFIADVNAFANSATLRRIMRRKLDAALRSLRTARQGLSR